MQSHAPAAFRGTHALADLLDLMRPDPRPVWRDGAIVTHEARPWREGDLQFLWNDYREARAGGKWFRFDVRDSIWRCLDPFRHTGINRLPDQPPALDRHGRLTHETVQ